MEKSKILVVEDENIVALDIKNRLKKLGYSVPSIASTGEEAINKADTTFADLVLMDIMLKGEIDGIEAADQINRRFNIPVIYLTAYVDDKILERAKLTRPYGYISKPFKEKDLHTNIEMALHRHKMEKEDNSSA